MSITISAAQRDALYGHILNRVTGIGDVWNLVKAENLAEATTLADEYADYLRLVVDDLEFGEGSGQTIELRTAPDVLRRAFTRLQESAAGEREVHGAEWEERRSDEAANRLVAEASAAVLAELGSKTLG